MSEQMMPKTNTVNIDQKFNPRAKTHKYISILSSGMDDIYSLSRSTISVIPDKMTQNKKALPDIKKFPKNYHWGKLSDPKKLDSHDKELGNNLASSRTLSDSCEGTAKFSPNDNKNNNEASPDYLVHQPNESLSSDVVQQDVDRRKNICVLEKLHFQSKVIKFTNDFMYNYYIKMIRDKIKQPLCHQIINGKKINSIPLFHILNMSARAPLWHMSYKKVKNVPKKTEEYPFQVVYISYSNFEQNK